MLKRLGPIDVNCDAPSYMIVQACRQLAMQSPEDVRWCRMRHFLGARNGRKGLDLLRPWKMFRESGAAMEMGCFCGEKPPVLTLHIFTLSSGKELSYYLGQCSRCRTIFWEEG
jgi:hypothetical protein